VKLTTVLTDALQLAHLGVEIDVRLTNVLSYRVAPKLVTLACTQSHWLDKYGGILVEKKSVKSLCRSSCLLWSFQGQQINSFPILHDTPLLQS